MLEFLGGGHGSTEQDSGAHQYQDVLGLFAGLLAATGRQGLLNPSV